MTPKGLPAGDAAYFGMSSFTVGAPGTGLATGTGLEPVPTFFTVLLPPD